MTASKAKIEPGETSIDRAKVRKENGVYVFDWRIRLMDGRLLNRRSQGKTIGIARARARKTATELLRAGDQKTWKTTDLINDYIVKVSIPSIEASNLRKNTKLRYLAAIKQVIAAYKTSQNTKGYTIAGGTTFKALESVLRAVAREHGKESAHHARTVLSKYVLQSMVRDQLVENNLLLKESIDLNLPEDDNDAATPRGGHALTLPQYASIVQKLLSIVPEDGISKPKQGRFGLEDRIAKRRNTIDVTLLQAATGLRIGEANAITWKNIRFGERSQATVHISKALSKTHKMRDVPVLIPAVVERLQARKRASSSSSDYVIGSPTDASKIWDARNCSKSIANLYCELADELNIELLKTARSHVWRATLNTMLLGSVPEIIRAAYFGHTQEVNRDSYTDTTNVAPMLQAFNQLFLQLSAS
ncbi:site-specific integrase [Bifidobacterium sp. ESL0764]|uniref:site-specific integrase n=1 Tax=Bifidobacterium sp. ESL0764 TaxID=2983228 RepID=UPI0023F7FEEA|nr:site-specific integrase [Bifidobacterium sp. ESL0764]WEV65623.1 site-specific integrase [Bifidobacterium sp. ESL0764]